MVRAGIFIDTWGWLALGHRRDQAHQTVKQLFQELRLKKLHKT
jgi:predicted nucleic acid-binding protein